MQAVNHIKIPAKYKIKASQKILIKGGIAVIGRPGQYVTGRKTQRTLVKVKMIINRKDDIKIRNLRELDKINTANGQSEQEESGKN